MGNNSNSSSKGVGLVGTRVAAFARRLRVGARNGLSLLLAFLLVTEPAIAAYCAQPGKDGTTAPAGVVNTYYPGTASVTAGSTSISVGTPRGSAQAIAAGDLLLVIQMQDATIDTANNSGYGDNVNGSFANGYTAINQAGIYEYVRATGAVAGGAVSITGATGGGLVNSYNHAALSSGARRRSFQVIRVPQYANATISGTVTASAWDGSSGGIVAVDVAERLTFSGGTISVDGLGFRGGGARTQSGGAGGASSDYRSLASSSYHGAKGEGIAGTPRYVNNQGSLQDNLVEGYVNGSNARGAPANAGGGGSDSNPAANDENTGGGGGGNGGAGGQGGDAWCPENPPNCVATGGHPGGNVGEAAVTRVVMGGGGGAATTNNGTGTPGAGFASSGAAGGGMVFVRAGEIAGSGTIDADGASANSTVINDGTGGGGAGGSVVLASVRTVAGASLSVTANGGDGGTNTGGGDGHGPGGGGGGGVVLRTGTIAGTSSVFGGNAGVTQGYAPLTANYGATAGSSGVSTSISASSIPGVSGGGECTPTISKAFATSPVTIGSPSLMSISILNNNPTLAMTNIAFTDSYPAGLLNAATPGATKSCATAGTLTAAANGSSFALSGGTINQTADCTYSVSTRVSTSGDKTNTIAAGGITWNYGTRAHSSLNAISATVSVAPPLTLVKSSQIYADPENGTTNPKAIPGSFVAYTVTVANPGTYTVTNNSVIIIDATPANLWLYVGDVPGGTGPVMFQNGTPASGLTYTYSGLASTTDDVEFSNNNGTSWTYTPTPNASLVDPAVTHMRILPKGAMAAGSSFNLIFGYMVR